MGHIPKSKNKYVGIEIEFVSMLDITEANALLSKLKMTEWCDITRDGSIENDDGGVLEVSREDEDWNGIDEFGLELRVLSTEKDLPTKLFKLKGFLSKCGAMVNSSCGLHVHLDMRNRKLEDCVKRLLTEQTVLNKMIPYDRRQSRYCFPLRKEEVWKVKKQMIYNEIKKEFYIEQKIKFTPEEAPRYRDINVAAYTKYKTVEIRSHEGCVDIKEIYNWCKHLITICEGEGKIDTRYVKKRIKECS